MAVSDSSCTEPQSKRPNTNHPFILCGYYGWKWVTAEVSRWWLTTFSLKHKHKETRDHTHARLHVTFTLYIGLPFDFQRRESHLREHTFYFGSLQIYCASWKMLYNTHIIQSAVILLSSVPVLPIPSFLFQRCFCWFKKPIILFSMKLHRAWHWFSS